MNFLISKTPVIGESLPAMEVSDIKEERFDLSGHNFPMGTVGAYGPTVQKPNAARLKKE